MSNPLLGVYDIIVSAGHNLSNFEKFPGSF